MITPFRQIGLATGLVLLAILVIWPRLAAAQGVQLPHVPVRLAFIQGGADDVGLAVRLAPGWKFYWRTPGEGGVPAQFDWSGSQNLERADVLWPAPQRIPLGKSDINGYTEEVVLPIRIERRDAAKPVKLDLMLEYGVCKDICILRTDRLQYRETTPSSVEQALFAYWRARVPQAAAAVDLRLQFLKQKADRLIVGLRSATPLQSPDLFVEGAPDSWFGRPQIALMDEGREVRFEIPSNVPPASAGRPLRLTLVDGNLAADMVAQPEGTP